MARNTGRRQQNRPAADWNHFYVYGSACVSQKLYRLEMGQFVSQRKKEQAVR